MIKACKVIRQGKGLAAPLLKRSRILELPWDVRRQAQFTATDADLTAVEVSLSEEEPPLRGGDVLISEDGALVRVVAAEQALLRLSQGTEHTTNLARAAYELGQREMAVAFAPTHLLVQHSAQAIALAEQLHLSVERCEAVFEPAAALVLARFVVVQAASRISLKPPMVAKSVAHCQAPA